MHRGLLGAHYPALVVAFLVGLIYLLPNLLFTIEAGKDYHYPFLAMPDERHYASRIREVYDGHWTIANPDLTEYKAGPYFWQPFPELALGGAGKLLDISIETLLVLCDFLLPALMFIAAYAFCLRILLSKKASLLCSCALMLVSILIFGPPQALLYWIDRLGLVELNPFLNPKSSFFFSRSINPQFNLILLFLSFLSIHGTLFRRSRAYPFVSGGLLGLLFYCSFYYWSYVAAGIFLLGCYSLLTGDRRGFHRLVQSVIVAAVLSSLYWASFLELQGSPLYREALERTYFVPSHRPYLMKLEVATLAAFLVFCPLKGREYFFIGSFLVGGLLCENQHILTGKKMHPYHWSLYCQAPLMWVGLALMLRNAYAKWSGTRVIEWVRGRSEVLTTILVAGCMANAVHTQVVYVYAEDRELGPRPFFERSLPVWLSYQHLEGAFSWLNASAERDTVVLASTEVSALVTIFTHCNVLAAWHTHVYLVPDKEILERWLLKCFFFAVPQEKVFEILEPNLDGLCELCSWRTDEEARRSFRTRIETLYGEMIQGSLLHLLNKYQVKHVIYSPSEVEEYRTQETGFAPSAYPFLVRVAGSGENELFVIDYQSLAAPSNHEGGGEP